MNKEVRDQILHVVYGAVAVLLLTVLPVFSLIQREYYQTKERMAKVAREHGRENEIRFTSVVNFMWIDGAFWKRDLIFGYIGVVIGYGILTTLVWLVFL